MDLATLDTGLPTFLTALLGIPCDWRKQPRQVHVSASAQLDILTSNGVGWDELTSHDVSGPATTETVYGLREMTIQVTVWSLSQKLAESARFYLERLRTRLRWSSSLAALDALGIALIGVMPMVLIDAPQDGRTPSQGSLDLRFAFGVAESDAPAPFIEKVDVNRTVDGDGPTTETIPS